MNIFGSSVWLQPLVLALLSAAAPLRPPAWHPAENSPPPRAEPNGVLLFPCRFTRENDRCVWDGPAPAGFGNTARISLHLSCDRPETLRALTLYIRLPDGWRSVPLPVPEISGRTYFFSAADFQPDQPESYSPNGSRIQGVRLAAWKRGNFTGETSLRLHRFSAFQDSLFIVRADSSLASAEQGTARVLAQRISDWLKEMGIGHSLVSEELWRTLPPRQTRLLILPYNPRPDAAFLDAFQTFLKAGGRAIVFYSASPELASRMGLQLSPYRAAPTPVTWSAFSFDPPLGMIRTICQTSLHTIPAAPSHAGARVLAWWEGPNGERRPEPAWLESPAGWWMTHVLDPEDAPRKKRLLLELIGRQLPEKWDEAAETALARLLGEIPDADHIRLKHLADRKEWTAFWVECDRLTTEATRRAFASIPPPPPNYRLAGWAQPGPGFLSSDWPLVAPQLRSAGITRLFLSATAFGQSHVPGSPLPPSDIAAFDPAWFEAALRSAQNAGIEVHAWITVFPAAYSPPTRLTAWRLAGRLMQTPNGEVPWLTPAHPENRRFLLDVIEDLLRRFPVAGIHLDYIRMPGEGVDISAAARKAFEAARGPIARWPDEVLPGREHEAEYRAWWIAQIQEFVRDARRLTQEIRPAATLSAAVFPEYPYCRDGLMQDWAEWLQADAVDEVYPMSYTASPTEFDRWLSAYRAMPGWGLRIHPGIGLYADTVTLDGPAFADQIRRAREAGAAGAAIFWINRPFLRDLAPLLEYAPFRPKIPASAASPAKSPKSHAPTDK